MYNADEMVDSPYNLCNYYAATSDIQTAGLLNTISNQCKTVLGKAPNGVEANVDTYPYKLCLIAENATFSGLSPSASQSVVAQDSFNNTTNQNVSHTFSLNGIYANSLQMSTVNTVQYSAGVSFSVDIPETFEMKFDMNTTFTSSKATTQSTTISESYDSSTTLTCNPGCDYTASLDVHTLTYKASFEVPICLSGYARCSYNDRVNGHYWWYLLIDDFVTPDQRCVNQAGILGSAISIDSTTSLSKSCN